MSFATIPALLSALFIAGGVGVAAKSSSTDGITHISSKHERKEGKDSVCAGLGCTPEQKAAIKRLRDLHVDLMQAEKEELHILKLSLHREMSKTNPDREVVASLRLEIEQYKARVAARRAELKAKMHEILASNKAAASSERERRAEARKHAAMAEREKKAERSKRAEMAERAKKAERVKRAEMAEREHKAERSKRAEMAERERGKSAKRERERPETERSLASRERSRRAERG